MEKFNKPFLPNSRFTFLSYKGDPYHHRASISNTSLIFNSLDNLVSSITGNLEKRIKDNKIPNKLDVLNVVNNSFEYKYLAKSRPMALIKL